MTPLLQEGKVDKKTIDEIAAIVAKFHSEAQTNAEITEIGGIKAVKINWDENFAQTTKYNGQSISKADFDFMQTKINSFMDRNKALFEAVWLTNGFATATATSTQATYSSPIKSAYSTP